MQQKIAPCLWFGDKAEEAMQFYVSIFKNSKIVNVARFGDAGPGPSGTVMAVTAEIDGVEFMALNGAPPEAHFTEGTSFFVKCATQPEVDYLWDRLCEGGEPSQCGWLKDRYGLSWQIIPDALMELMGDKDPEKAGRVMQAMLKMQKIDVPTLQAAYNGL